MAVRKAYGFRRDERDPRDRIFTMKLTRASLPATVDLRKWMPPIMEQGDIGSCVAHAACSTLQWHVKRAGGPVQPLSRLGLYFFTRQIEGTVLEDAGCEARNCIKAIKKFGVAPETLWPYVESKFKDTPPKDWTKLGDYWNSLTYERVPVNNNSVKTALASGFPVMIGLTLFESFESERVEKTGIVPYPDIDKEGTVGGHEMLAVGYGQKKGYFTVANSWSTEWGDKGYCYIPERIVGSPFFGADYWIIKNLGGA
jgi:C1A family cysteine protease